MAQAATLAPGVSNTDLGAIAKIFSPKSVAIIGASPSPGTIGNVMLENLIENGFTGPIYPVNPKYEGPIMADKAKNLAPFVKDASRLPKNAVDLAVIMSPIKTVPAVLRQLGAKGVTAAVVISAGAGETGAEGKALEADIQKALAETGIKMIGPNCVGVANGDLAVKMNATFVPGKMPPGQGAIMSQSGAVSIDLIQQARWNGLGFAHMASIGNQTNIDSSQLLNYWKSEPKVKYVLGYLESINNPQAFREVAASVTKEKPVILLKSGRSSHGAKAASSHTGALAGSDTAVDTLFAQTGVQRVDSIQQLFAVAKAFELSPPSKGGRVGFISNSGGYGVMLTDIVEGEGNKDLDATTLSEDTTAALKTLLPPQASTSNPVDTIATTPSNSPENFKKAMLAMVNDPNVDSLVVSVVPLLAIDAAAVGRAISEVQAETDKPVFGVLSVSEQQLLDVQETLTREKRKIPPLYRTLENAMVGLTALEKHRKWSTKPVGQVATFEDVKPEVVRKIVDQARQENRKLLTTTESLDILAAYGIRTPKYALVSTLQEAQEQANTMGYPVAIKIVSKTHTHKTDIGGVVIDLRTPEQLQKAFVQMMANLEKAGIKSFEPGEGIMVQQFIGSGRETLIGFKEDPIFGKMLAFGVGGIYVNTLKDVSFRLPPISAGDAKDMIQGIKMLDILKGARGKKPVDFETLEETILRYSQLTQDFPELEESDINPFFAQPKPSESEKGGIAVDARFSLKDNPPVASLPPSPLKANAVNTDGLNLFGRLKKKMITKSPDETVRPGFLGVYDRYVKNPIKRMFSDGGPSGHYIE